jgi:MFS family permease
MGVKSLPILYLICILVQIAMSMAYTAQYTVMMDKSELATAGTDYTLQASVVYFGGIGASILSGFIANAVGYTALFVICVFLGLLSVVMIAKTFDGT